MSAFSHTAGDAPAGSWAGSTADTTSAALAEAFLVSGRGAFTDTSERTSFEACLAPFLRALGWRGEARHIIEALPHFDRVNSLDEFRMVVGRLGFPTEVDHGRLADMASDQFPFLFVIDGRARVALALANDGQLLVDEGRGPDLWSPPPGAKRATMVRARDPEERAVPGETARSWFWGAFSSQRSALRSAMLLTFFANMLALATPLFTMAIYNNVVIGGELATLVAAVAIVILAVLYEGYLKRIRTDVVSTIAARLSATISRKGFERVLLLPQSMVETASVGVQIARLRQFDGVLNAFTGPLAAALLDLPFTIIFIVAIAIVGGPLVAIPVALALLFVVVGFFLLPISQRNTRALGTARIQTQELTLETFKRMDAIRGLGMETIWMGRMRSVLTRTAKARLKVQAFDLITNNGAQVLTSSAGVLVLVLGAVLVIAGDVTVGALIAVMMLVWKVLAPIQTTFLALPQVISVRDTVRQIDTLMNMPIERDLEKAPTIYRQFKGRLQFEGLTFKYSRSQTLALRNVTLKIQAGEVVGLVGRGGSGRSTLFKTLLGFYKPSGGAIILDSLNLSQLDPGEVRAAIGYAPKRPAFFFGTVAQNMRLAHRTATDEEIERVITQVGVDLTSSDFPDGVATRLSPQKLNSLPDRVKLRLSLARAFVKPSPILLIDHPFETLDDVEAAAVVAEIERRRGSCTVLMNTCDRRVLERCDRVVAMARGAVVVDDAPGPALERCASIIT